ncbi:MAG TPA: hypothetical protein VFY84_06760 [Jiangellales bacterium]|nr:hypothetical protein [Jiangellales bacterium]
MSTPSGAATTPERPRWRRRWWLISELAALAVLLVALVYFLVPRSSSTGGGGPTDLPTAAGERAARALEQASPAEHHDHGHEVTGYDQVYCGVDVFGVDPPSAGAIDDVQTVYGYYFCAVGRPGVPYLESSRSDGPIVVTLSNPPTIQIAPPGVDYQERVRAMMPDQYEELCFGGLRDPTVADEVKRRYESDLT